MDRREAIPSSNRRVLVAAVSHGEPPTCVRVERLLDFARHLPHAGVEVDAIVLQEKLLATCDADRLLVAAAAARRFENVLDPRDGTILGRTLAALEERFSPFLPRAGQRTPRAFVKRVCAWLGSRPYDLVIVHGRRLIGLAGSLRVAVPIVYDSDRGDRGLRDACCALGREDVLETSQRVEAESLGKPAVGYRAILAPSAVDAARLRATGVQAPILIVPPVVVVEDEPILVPLRPPRILAVGSERLDNLDGLRWFRRRVLPRVLASVPTARLRIVGECGRHLEPGLDVERVGRVEDLRREYREAAIVVLPLRIDGGLRRRAVEALAHGRVLATTPEGAAGLELARDEAIISADEEELATTIARVLSDDSLRKAIERRALSRARERFAPERGLAAIVEWIGAQSDPGHRHEALVRSPVMPKA